MAASKKRAQKAKEGGSIHSMDEDITHNFIRVGERKPEDIQPFKRRVVQVLDLKNLIDEYNLNERMDIVLFNRTSPVEFSVQFCSGNLINNYQRFHKQLNDVCSLWKSAYKPEKIGQLVVCKFDGMWYRAEVLSISDKTAKVRYIDFGNDEENDFTSIQCATEECTRLPVHVCECSLFGIGNPINGIWPVDVVQKFMDLTSGLDEKSFEAVYKGKVNGRAMVDIIDYEKKLSVASVISQMMYGVGPKSPTAIGQNQNKHVADVVHVNNSSLVKASDIPMEELICDGKRVAADVKAIERFDSFYIQLVDKQFEDTVIQLQEQLADHCSEIDMPYNPVIGEIVCARFSADNNWYRAEVLDKGRLCTVLFVDIGKKEVVSPQNIRQIQSSLLTVPKQAIHCQLTGVVHQNQMEEAFNNFKTCMQEALVHIVASEFKHGIYSVTVIGADDSSVNELYTTKAYHLDNLHFGQRDINKDEKVTREVLEWPGTDSQFKSGVAHDNDVKDPRLCEDVAHVSIIHAGERQEEEIQPIAQSQNKHVADVVHVNNSALVKASDIPKEELICDGKRVAADVKAIERFDSFYIQLVDKQFEDTVIQLQEQLADHCSEIDMPYNPVIGEIVCARFSADNNWYRAEVLDKGRLCTVLFVDIGKKEIMSPQNIRQIQSSLLTVPKQAIHCQLTGVVHQNQMEEVFNNFKTCMQAALVHVVASEFKHGIYSVTIIGADDSSVNELCRSTKGEYAAHASMIHAGERQEEEIQPIAQSQNKHVAGVVHVNNSLVKASDILTEESQCVYFGKKEIVSPQNGQIKPSLLLTVPKEAVHCQLTGNDHENQMKETFNIFKACMQETKVHAEGREFKDGKYSVALFGVDAFNEQYRTEGEDLQDVQEVRTGKIRGRRHVGRHCVI